jgi:hypothetical protein
MQARIRLLARKHRAGLAHLEQEFAAWDRPIAVKSLEPADLSHGCRQINADNSWRLAPATRSPAPPEQRDRNFFGDLN